MDSPFSAFNCNDKVILLQDICWCKITNDTPSTNINMHINEFAPDAGKIDSCQFSNLLLNNS